MCGIAGKVTAAGPSAAPTVELMCAAIEHRGPDSRGLYTDDRATLGIQRLRVIDLATGDQPIFNEDRTVVVVFNGEIYNYVELRDDLRARGHTFSTATDTEVIVHLYEEVGPACVAELRGMFAFALWDTKRRRLMLARDRVGKKPLFYAARPGALSFASELNGLLQDPDLERRPNLAAIDSYLHSLYVPAPATAFAGIQKLEPAHTLLWRDGELETQRYWQLSFATGDFASPADAHEPIRDALLEATRIRMRSDVPLGAFLSGGLDSSAVVAAMARQSSGRVQTFSIGFDVAAYDETAHARAVARLFDTDHHELRMEPQAMEILPRLVWHYGEPFADHSAIPSFYLAELTRRHVTVALNGDGGDESFAGYRRHGAGAVVDRLARLPGGVRVAAARLAGLLGPGPTINGPRARFRRAAAAAVLPPADRYAMWVAAFQDAERAALYSDEFRAAAGGSHAVEPFRGAWHESDALDPVNRRLDVDIRTYLPGDLLVKMDIASMAHSLEVRSPLLDHRLMELAASLPGSFKADGRTSKKVFKDAMRPWLPAEIVDRPKWGFGVPVGAWFRGALRSLPREVLLDERSLSRGLFRPEAVRGVLDDHESGRRDNTDRIWALMQLELWFRTFIDARRSVPLALDVA